jgi:hypothetical protein
MKDINKKTTKKELTEQRVREIIREELLKRELDKISRHDQIDTLVKDLQARKLHVDKINPLIT